MSALVHPQHRLALPALAFSVVLVVGYGSDLLFMQHSAWMIADDLVLGVSAALVVLLYERDRFRFLSDRLVVIREMNAFIRNELQMLYASFDQSEKARVSTIERAIERIEWALRELLPGHLRKTARLENSRKVKKAS
jgi:hypothetical protein